MSYLLWDNRVRKKKEGFAMAKKKLDIEVFSAWNTYATVECGIRSTLFRGS